MHMDPPFRVVAVAVLCVVSQAHSLFYDRLYPRRPSFENLIASQNLEQLGFRQTSAFLFLETQKAEVCLKTKSYRTGPNQPQGRWKPIDNPYQLDEFVENESSGQTRNKKSYGDDIPSYKPKPAGTDRPSYNPRPTGRPSYTPSPTNKPSYSPRPSSKPTYEPDDDDKPMYVIGYSPSLGYTIVQHFANKFEFLRSIVRGKLNFIRNLLGFGIGTYPSSSYGPPDSSYGSPDDSLHGAYDAPDGMSSSYEAPGSGLYKAPNLNSVYTSYQRPNSNKQPGNGISDSYRPPSKPGTNLYGPPSGTYKVPTVDNSVMSPSLGHRPPAYAYQAPLPRPTAAPNGNTNNQVVTPNSASTAFTTDSSVSPKPDDKPAVPVLESYGAPIGEVITKVPGNDMAEENEEPIYYNSQRPAGGYVPPSFARTTERIDHGSLSGSNNFYRGTMQDLEDFSMLLDSYGAPIAAVYAGYPIEMLLNNNVDDGDSFPGASAEPNEDTGSQMDQWMPMHMDSSVLNSMSPTKKPSQLMNPLEPPDQLSSYFVEDTSEEKGIKQTSEGDKTKEDKKEKENTTMSMSTTERESEITENSTSSNETTTEPIETTGRSLIDELDVSNDNDSLSKAELARYSISSNEINDLSSSMVLPKNKQNTTSKSNNEIETTTEIPDEIMITSPTIIVEDTTSLSTEELTEPTLTEASNMSEDLRALEEIESLLEQTAELTNMISNLSGDTSQKLTKSSKASESNDETKQKPETIRITGHALNGKITGIKTIDDDASFVYDPKKGTLVPEPKTKTKV